jgi:phage shock protein A
MGIFSRLTDIINSNINALLDKAEDPQKMIRLIIQEMEETLVEVRSTSARVIADRKDIERKLARLSKEADEWDAKARLALSKDREDLAKAALAEKNALNEEIAHAEADFAQFDEQLQQLDTEIHQLQAKLNDAKTKQKSLVMRAKTTESRLNARRQTNRDALDRAFSRFDAYERRIDDMESEMEAMDLGSDEKTDLAKEIAGLESNDKLEEELARLKEEMNK